NEYNRFNREGVTQERLIQEYFSRFIDNALFSTHRAFNMLDSEFREKRFNNSLQEFERYIDRNFVYLAGSRLERYSVAQGEGYTRYVLIDQGERIFILLETGIMQFTVILDTYTLDLPEFVERYMSANSQERVALNIQRLIQALNEQDYRFVYNRLAESFRQNYFQELGHFEAYIRHTLPERMQIEHLAFNEESGLYMQTIRFIDISDENREPVEKRIVMELREGTDFVFAFNIIQ
ncbi:MAG: hypothetical protein FWC68_02905, partial [Oscillospiraceae bacterium]|nr:hypothetical protein [Oscillospiraceae bacterium]